MLRSLNPGARESDRLATFDFSRHNEEARAVWDAFHAKAPLRAPVILGTNTRYFVFGAANPEGVSFRDYFNDPRIMFDRQLEHQRWSRFNLLQDTELGLPERWTIGVDFQNCYEAAWFGCPIIFINDEVPDTEPAYLEAPEAFLEADLPNPFGGLLARALEFDEMFRDWAMSREFCGRPITIGHAGAGLGTDGPVTVACNLLGPTWVCTAMAEEPELLAQVFTKIIEGTLKRIRAWRKHYGMEPNPDGMWIADDSIALISTPMYVEHVLPHHRRLYEVLGSPRGRGIHLCGDATRHFPTLVRELGITAFDTGFPVDFARLREELGPDVLIQGGPHVTLVRDGKPAEIAEECLRILRGEVAAGGRFVLREGNNLAPHTPLENTEAMLAASRQCPYPRP